MFSNKRITFTTFFLLYLGIVFFFSKETLIGDERRYAMFAENLANGFYSPRDEINIWNGPGYPLILAPFIYFKIDLLYAKIFNVLFLLFAVIYVYKTINLYTNNKTALISAAIMGLYYPFYLSLPYLLTEIFAVFLISGFIFHLINAYQVNKKRQLVTASVFLGLLCLTKVIFAYVILLAGIVLILFLIKNHKSKVKSFLIIIVLAITWCIPYLIYTYNLTGKIYYWANSGGSSLYWMSNPVPNESGEWHGATQFKKFPQLKINHGKFMDSISKLDGVKRDETFKKKALENIKNHPIKYLSNWIANWGRLIFSYPYDYTYQKVSTFFFLPNGIIVLAILLSIYPALVFKKNIPAELLYLLFFNAVYLLLSSFVSAYPRQFFPAIPFITVFLTYITSLVNINISFGMKDTRTSSNL